MANNPYPTALQLRAEAAVDRLLAAHEASAGSFRAAATAFLALLRDLHFPLGSPVQGWDLPDIDLALSQWAHDVRDELALEEIARDTIEEALANDPR